MAFRWQADCGPTLNAGLVASWFYKGSGPVLVRYPICLCFFHGGLDPLDPHMKCFYFGLLSGVNAVRSSLNISTHNRLKHEATEHFPPVTGIRDFTEMKFGPINILDVVGGNSTETAVWDIYKIYSQINITIFNMNTTKYQCCMKYGSPRTAIYKYQTEDTYMYRKYRTFGLYYFVCTNKYHKVGQTPIGVAITVSESTCSEDDVVFIEPYHPLRQPGRKLVIGAKLAYANISAMSILEWMEANKFLGVDKIVAYYVSSLNNDALKVLNYYATTGFLDLYFFKPFREGRRYSSVVFFFFILHHVRIQRGNMGSRPPSI